MKFLKIYNKKRKLGIKNIFPDDAFICSFPKSGNTWVRFILANALSNETITLKNINKFVPGVHAHSASVNEMNSPRYIKSHFPYFELYPKTVYIHRDFRDVVTSFYHFKKGQGKFTGTLDDFYRTINKGAFGSWNQHVEKALTFQNENPNRIFVLSYSDLHDNFEAVVTNLLGFLNINSKRSTQELKEETGFEKLKSLEKSFGNVQEQKEEFSFFRSGLKSGFGSELPVNIQEEILQDENNLRLLKKLGYQ